MSQLIGFSRIHQAAERQRRLQNMVGESIMLKVIEVNRRRRRLILSQRAAAKEWRAARRETLLEELEPDQIRRGRISQITNFGLFVNLGGLDGLVHISELSWGRIENPSEVYREGQRVKVKVLNVDRERQRIALSIKALTPDPWDIAPEKYAIGSLVEGKVTQVVDFGVFVELEPGVEGLLHNTELRDVEQRNELESGETVLIKIIRVEPDRRRIGLSVKQVRPDEWEEWVMASWKKPKRQQKLAAAEAAAKAAAAAEAAAAEAAAAEAAAKAAEAEAARPKVEETEESTVEVVEARSSARSRRKLQSQKSSRAETPAEVVEEAAEAVPKPSRKQQPPSKK